MERNRGLIGSGQAISLAMHLTPDDHVYMIASIKNILELIRYIAQPTLYKRYGMRLKSRPNSHHAGQCRQLPLLLALALLALMIIPASGLAGTASSGAQALFFNPSVRSAAMGGAGAALWWGGDANDWANPALLAYHRGIRYHKMQTDLIPQLSNSTTFSSKRLTVGWEGIGFLEAGKIGLVGGGQYDMGNQMGTDENGEITGLWQPWAQTHAMGLGVDLIRLGHLLGWQDLDPTRWSLSVGHVWKSYEDLLAPGSLLQDVGDGGTSVSTRDAGAFLRWTPLNSLNGKDSWLPSLGGARLDLAAGVSRQNYNKAEVIYVDSDQADPVAKSDRLCASVVLAVGNLADGSDGSFLNTLFEGMSPLVSAAVIFEKRNFVTPAPLDWTVDWSDWSRKANETGYGIELTLANIVSYRLGHLEDEDDGISGKTSGWSLGIPIGTIAGFRYDRATVPQRAILEDVTREGWTAYIDVLKLWHMTQKSEGEYHGSK